MFCFVNQKHQNVTWFLLPWQGIIIGMYMCMYVCKRKFIVCLIAMLLFIPRQLITVTCLFVSCCYRAMWCIAIIGLNYLSVVELSRVHTNIVYRAMELKYLTAIAATCVGSRYRCRPPI